MIHGWALHRAPIFLSKSAAWLAFLSAQRYCPGRLACQNHCSFGEAPSRESMVYFLGSSWGWTGSWSCSLVFVPFWDRGWESFNWALPAVHALWRQKKSGEEICAYGEQGQRGEGWGEWEGTQNSVSTLASAKLQGIFATLSSNKYSLILCQKSIRFFGIKLPSCAKPQKHRANKRGLGISS